MDNEELMYQLICKLKALPILLKPFLENSSFEDDITLGAEFVIDDLVRHAESIKVPLL